MVIWAQFWLCLIHNAYPSFNSPIFLSHELVELFFQHPQITFSCLIFTYHSIIEFLIILFLRLKYVKCNIIFYMLILKIKESRKFNISTLSPIAIVFPCMEFYNGMSAFQKGNLLFYFSLIALMLVNSYNIIHHIFRIKT